MPTYNKNGLNCTDLAKKHQRISKIILIPSKRTLLDYRPELRSEKYVPNYHIEGYLENSSNLLNKLNAIRGWHQNGTDLRSHIKDCSKDFQDIQPLLQFQFSNIRPMTPIDPYEYVTRVACKSLIYGLTWTQLKNELKNPILTNFEELTCQIMKLFNATKARQKCPTCDLRVISLSNHMKSHRKMEKQKQLVNKFMQIKVVQDRLYYQELTNTRYNFATFEQLFE